jgi:hypothetical protein
LVWLIAQLIILNSPSYILADHAKRLKKKVKDIIRKESRYDECFHDILIDANIRESSESVFLFLIKFLHVIVGCFYEVERKKRIRDRNVSILSICAGFSYFQREDKIS